MYKVIYANDEGTVVVENVGSFVKAIRLARLRSERRTATVTTVSGGRKRGVIRKVNRFVPDFYATGKGITVNSFPFAIDDTVKHFAKTGKLLNS